ncbi:MAG TPA: Gfo/Idh/MocA family oxidoreductase [Bacteroidota bacterium]|nr:Gfo/Idh/MocA family oxidoreductase [Bacteroidota bacterium]
MLRGAIVGFGNIAVRGHVPAYKHDFVCRDMEITAVLDVVEQSHPRVAEALPGARFYTDIDALFSREQLDFVDICTPPHTHAECIRAAVSKNIHVLCEKPLAEKFETAKQIDAAIRGAGITFVPCHQYKYSPLWSTIGELIHSGVLGAVTLAQFNVYRMHADTGTAGWKPEWRTNKTHSGGGILVDTGAHYYYLAQYFFGMPQKISALLRSIKHREYGVEDTAVVTLEYPALLMQLTLTWAASNRANSVYIAGTSGSLSYDGSRLLHTTEQGTRQIPMPDVSDKNQYIEWYAKLFQEFARRVNGKIVTTDLLEESVNVMNMLEVSYRSSDRQTLLGVE